MTRPAKDGAGKFAYVAVYRYLLDLVADVEPGQRIKLPSLRTLGRKLSVSVSTVQTAYALLEAEGRIESVVKSGYFAEGPAAFAAAPGSRDLLQRMLASACQPNVRAFSRGTPAPATAAVRQLLRLETELIRRYPAGLTGMAQPCGELELRRVLAARYTRSLQDYWRADDVYVGGDLNAILEMTWTAMTLHGKAVVVVAPCSWRMLRTLHGAGAQVLELVLDDQGKLPLARLQMLLSRYPVALVVLCSSYLWPSGAAMSDGEKRAVATLLAREGVWVAEDDTQADMCFVPAVRFRELLDPQRLLVFGSLQSALGAEAPFAWLLSRHWQASLQRLCLQRSVHPPPLRQKALARFIASGAYDALLQASMSCLRPAVLGRSAALREALGEQVHTIVPGGGATLWAVSHQPVDMRSVFETLRRQQWLIAPGDVFSLQGQCQHHLRLDATRHDDTLFAELLVALGTALKLHRI